MKKFIENWKKKRALKKRQKDVSKAREYIYNYVLRNQYLVSETPTYHFSKFEPKKFWTRTWKNPDTNIKVIRARFIRADLVEVFYHDNLVANWVDQDHQYGLGINDFACTESFTLELVKGNAKS